jgi:hypothetical protein
MSKPVKCGRRIDHDFATHPLVGYPIAERVHKIRTG